MLNLKSFSDIEIDSKIQNISKKIYQTNNLDILHQLYDYLDALYAEQDERYELSLTSMDEGLALDTEKSYEEIISGGKSKEGKKPKEKTKSFLDKMPKIEPKWNKSNPRNKDE